MYPKDKGEPKEKTIEVIRIGECEATVETVEVEEEEE